MALSVIAKVWGWRRAIATFGSLAVLMVGLSGAGYWVIAPPRLLASANEKLTQGRYVAACRDLEWYTWMRPSDSNVRLLRARCLLGIGSHRAKEAVTELAEIPDEDALGSEARLREAEILLMLLNRAADAERSLRRALELDSSSFGARQGLFQIHWWQGRKTADVQQWLEEMYEFGNTRQRLTALGQLFWMRYADCPADVAFPMMVRFLRADPADHGARVGLARLLMQDQRHAEGVKLLRECIAEKPDDAIARWLLVEFALAKGDWALAGEYLDSWPESAFDWRYWRLRGEYYQSGRDDPKRAIPCFEQALAARQDLWSVRYKLSQCLEAAGQPEQAKAERERAQRNGQSLLDTRMDRLLQEVLPNLESRPQGCQEIAELFQELGEQQLADRWVALGRELEVPASSRTISSTPPERVEAELSGRVVLPNKVSEDPED